MGRDMDRATAEEILIRHGFEPRHFASERFWFLKAFKEGPIELAEAFVVCGMPMRAPKDREPPVVKAAESGKLAHVLLALRLGASLDTRDVAGDTALHTAANWGHAQLVRELADLGATADTMNEKKWTPLVKALKEGKADVVDTLLEIGADPNFGRERQVTPLTFAKSATDLRKLLEAGADPHMVFKDGTGNTLVLSKTAAKKRDELRLLLEHGARDLPNAVGWTAWMVAKNAGSDDLVALLEKHGSEPRDGWDTSLHAAAQAGDLRRVDALLEEGADVNAINRFGSTALLSALSKSHLDVASRLLDAGADPSLANVYANSPLTFAASKGELAMTERLLEAGAPPNEGDDPEDPDAGPRSLGLVLAAAAGHLEIVQRLVEAGANLASKDKFQQTAVFLAGSKGHPDVLRYLLEAGADPNLGGRERFSPLLITQGNHHPECVRLLVEAGADLEKTALFDRTALARVCDHYKNDKPAHGEIVRILLDAGADFVRLDWQDRSAYDVARSSKNRPAQEAMERFLVNELLARHFTGDRHAKTTLLETGVLEDVGAIDWPALVTDVTVEHLKAFVTQDRQPELRCMLEAQLPVELFTEQPQPVLFDTFSKPPLVTMLLDFGADPLCEKNGETTLMRAVKIPELVPRLLRAGVDPNARSFYGSTAMTRAASEGALESAELLRAAGADINPVRGGWSPLMRAAQAGHLELVEWLLAQGADPNVRSANGITALEAARKKKHEAIVERLAHITSPDVPDAQGRTTLFKAAMKGELRTIEQLLDAGADPEHADHQGDTPKTVAALREDVAAIFEVAHAPHRPARLRDDEAFLALYRREDPEIPVDARNYRGDTPLHVAAARGHQPLVEKLLAEGADVHAENERGDTPWSVAVGVGNWLTELLQAHGAKVDVNKQVVTTSAVHDFRGAIGAGDLREVDRRLDEKQVNLHLLTHHNTPLSVAIAAGDLEMVQMLLDKGADPNVPCWSSLLAYAAYRGRHAILSALLDAGAAHDPDALQKAAESGQAQAMETLLDAGLPPRVDVSLVHRAESLRFLVDLALERGLGELGADAMEKLDQANASATG